MARDGSHDTMTVPITRHSKVQGKRSPLNPGDQEYWALRRLPASYGNVRSSKRQAC